VFCGNFRETESGEFLWIRLFVVFCGNFREN
jgi:hypothetical protein